LTYIGFSGELANGWYQSGEWGQLIKQVEQPNEPEKSNQAEKQQHLPTTLANWGLAFPGSDSKRKPPCHPTGRLVVGVV